MSGPGQPQAVKNARAKEAEFYMELPQVTRCTCGASYVGTAGEGREWAREHRRAEHPELPVVTPRIRGRKRAGQKLRKWDGRW